MLVNLMIKILSILLCLGMAQKKHIIFFVFVTSLCTFEIACNKREKSEDPEKIESDESEWRVLGKDEPVPRGSHVQLDLTTGEHRIKVVDSEKTMKKDKTSVIPLKLDEEASEKTIEDELRFRFHRMKGDDPVESDQVKDKVKNKFKTYEELKKDFEDLHMAVKTDIEIMNGLLESYKELIDDKVPVTEELQQQQITILTDLEYLLHQIDNANEFVKNGGLTNIVLPSLNSTSSGVRSGSARLLGSAAQSNVGVQIAAFESGAVEMLLRLLVLDKTPPVRSSALYALSCLVRRFPIAQKKFVDEGGLTVLNKLFSTEAPDELKIKVKVLTFIYDLIVEKQEAEKTFTLSKETNSNVTFDGIREAKERLRQYNLIGLETKLQEQRWCEQLANFLIEHVSLHLNVILEEISVEVNSLNAGSRVEHDVIEKIILAMISSSNLCMSDYEVNHKLKKLVRFLYIWYKKLAKVDEDDYYYSYLIETVERFSWKYKFSLQESIKDEL